VRKQVTLVILLMVGFAGASSSAVLTRALAQSKSVSAVEQEKRLGPKPTPHWYWRWVEWRLGEGYASGRQLQPRLRPKNAPTRIQTWAWQRLHFFLLARKQRELAGQDTGKKRRGHTTTGTTTTRTTTTSTTTTTTTTTTSSGGGGGTYADAISYTQTHPSFTPKRTIEVSNATQLQSAISNLQAGDLVQAPGSFTVSGETVIKNRLSSPAELDLTGVRFVYSGGENRPAVWLNNAENLYIYGGDTSTADTGGQGILVYGSQHVLWWGFTIHDTGNTGFSAQATGGPVDHDDFAGTIWKIGQNLAWDPHAEKGTGLHGANLWDANQTGNFTNNRFAFYAHDIPTGACVEFGNDQPASLATGNVLYLKCVNETEAATLQTGGNALQTWGDTNTLGLDVKYLEGDNLQGFGYRDSGIFPGQNAKGVKIEYGRVSNTNLNTRYAGQNPWQDNFGELYQDALPTP
jgi:hypothetical protein